MRQDERDRLRVLVLDERREVLGIGLGQKRERLLVDLVFDGLEDPHRLVVGKSLLQQAPGVDQAALLHVLPGERKVVELLDDGTANLRVHEIDLRDLPRDHLDRVLIEVLQHGSRRVPCRASAATPPPCDYLSGRSVPS